ncbi:MAG: hypothetical protein ACJ8F7_08780 [Gemmataceae bacterium]
MRIAGEWHSCDDGITRPVLVVRIHGDGGLLWEDRFLIDSGADRTVFSADLYGRTGLPASTPIAGGLVGVGGAQSFVILATAIEFTCDDGTQARVRGDFAAFPDPSALDMSVLGRDVLNNFDLILSRPRNEVLLLAAPHRYRVEL